MADDRTQRALQIMEAIRTVLVEEWDPIGVRENPHLRDEYDTCIAPVYRLLINGVSSEVMCDHLSKLEHDLGMPAKSKEHLPAIVARLKRINVKFGPDAA